MTKEGQQDGLRYWVILPLMVICFIVRDWMMGSLDLFGVGTVIVGATIGILLFQVITSRFWKKRAVERESKPTNYSPSGGGNGDESHF
ncbi:MAG: hypothetical protein BroJett003_25400 [Planctomycetota bacterium]|nr:MAG: hypothetical protein BroJett003_25400 [Planctomycetota bacterium]